MAALRLRETEAPKYSQDYWLQYAEDHYSFWMKNMVNRTTGQVCDNFNLKGERTWWSFTYNNGLMLGAAVHLYNATLNQKYLADAALLSGYLLDGMNVTVNGSMRAILQNDCGGGCSDDGSQFHQVGFQYLTEYYRLLYVIEVQNYQQYLQLQVNAAALYSFLQANIDSLWLNARDKSKGTFNCNWDRPFDGKGKDGLQGSMNTALSAFSLFAALPLPHAQLVTSH